MIDPLSADRTPAALRMMIIRTLRQAGIGAHDVVQAADGAEALKTIRKGKPDLVLADWNMPKMTGMQLLQELRNDGNDVTFGFITTEATAPMRIKASEAGAKFLIAKPFTVEIFQRVFESVRD